MNRKPFFSKVTAALTSGLSLAIVMFFAGCAGDEKEIFFENPATGTEKEAPFSENPAPETKTEAVAEAEPSKVYFTSDISADGLMAAYNALEQKPSAAQIASGKVAVKLHSGEGPNSNYLRPAFIQELVTSVNGTIVEANTAYPGSSRATTAAHLQVVRDRGFTGIAKVDILDSTGSTELPISNGTNINQNYVGSHFTRYDYYVVLSHFKGHIMGGFGGAIKNISIGIASKEGKCWIHTAGKSKTNFNDGRGQDAFLDAMAEAGKSIVDHLNGNILYINVMNRISIDCDCFADPKAPDMHDIGILSSLDPVALDQACVDLVKAAPTSQNATLLKRMNDQNATRVLTRGEAIGLGSKTYELIPITGTSIREPDRTVPGRSGL